MRLVTMGNAPQRLQMWNSAVRVANAWCDTLSGSATLIFRTP